MHDAYPHSFGPFRVTERLGDERFGPVYRVEDATGRPFVARTVTEPLTDEQRVVLMAAWTAACAAPLDHPGIAKPVASGEEGGLPYIVHDWVDGEPLERLPGGLRHGVAALLPALTRVAAALDFAAAAGVCHGSLTAGDILIREEAGAVVGLGVLQGLREAGIDVPMTSDVEAFALIVYAARGEQPLNFDAPDSALAFVARLQRELVESEPADITAPAHQPVFLPGVVSHSPASGGRKRWIAVTAVVAASSGFAGGYLLRDSTTADPVVVAAPAVPDLAVRAEPVTAMGQMPTASDAATAAVASPVRARRNTGGAPSPAAAAGALDVVSRPSGARVFLDGRLMGTTPLVLSGVSPGTHAVRLDLAAHRPWVTRLDLAPGSHVRVAGSLER